MPLTIIDRFHPRLRAKQQAAIDAGHINKIDEVALLEQEQLLPLAVLSLRLLLIGALCFGALNYAVYAWREHTFDLHPTATGVLLWLAINAVAYFPMLLLHGAAFLLWGGRPYLGLKLPYALYCGAKNQLFRRDQYLVVGLAPLVVITLAGIILTLLSPVLASYTLSVTVGNISGAAGDIWSARRLMRLPATALVEDTESGYRAWEVTTEAEYAMIDASEIELKGGDQMASLNLSMLASILVGVDPTGQHNLETQFVRGEEIATLRQMLLDKYGKQGDIARALQARDADALAAAFSRANPPLDSDTEIVRLCQSLQN